MKANEMPERIYLFDYNEAMVKSLEGDTVYVREDAFIEKALKWYCLDCECNDNCKDTKCFFYREYERYLKGETNALQPKFSNGILNEDGSTSNNWRYRHFINKMKEAFIEKARKWFEKQNEWFDPNGNRHCDLNDFEDFRKYMEGE